MKKRKFSFSYLDVFLLLVGGLLISLAVYWGVETHRDALSAPAWSVTAKGVIVDALTDAVPAADDYLYDEKGNRIGQILTVETLSQEGEAHLTLVFYLEDETPVVGETFVVMTDSFSAELTIQGLVPVEKKELISNEK